MDIALGSGTFGVGVNPARAKCGVIPTARTRPQLTSAVLHRSARKPSTANRIPRGSVQRRLQIVAARTESSDLPLGNMIPDFEVRRKLVLPVV